MTPTETKETAEAKAKRLTDILEFCMLVNPDYQNAKAEIIATFKRCEELEQALKPFANYAEKFDQKPIGKQHDIINAIHSGTEWEAELRLSDCRLAKKLLEGK